MSLSLFPCSLPKTPPLHLLGPPPVRVLHRGSPNPPHPRHPPHFLVCSSSHSHGPGTFLGPPFFFFFLNELIPTPEHHPNTWLGVPKKSPSRWCAGGEDPSRLLFLARRGKRSLVWVLFWGNCAHFMGRRCLCWSLGTVCALLPIWSPTHPVSCWVGCGDQIWPSPAPSGGVGPVGFGALGRI